MNSELQTKTSRFFGAFSFRASVLVPFVIISIAFGVLAYRSHELSMRLQRGMKALAIQYLDYAAEITARTIDAQINSEMFQASEEWQQIERQDDPTVSSLRQWIDRHSWVVSAMYIPDEEPTEAVYIDLQQAEEGRRLTSEFYTASGTVKYTYDPAGLLDRARQALGRQPIVHVAHLPDAAELREQSEIEVISAAGRTGLVSDADRIAVVVPLAAPMDRYSVQASIRASYIGAALKNHRITSLAFAALAVLLLTVGAGFATRGLRRESEAMQLRSALIANVSHELRTPLSMIRLAAETLKRGTRLSPTEREDLQESILREVLHLGHLVENVLDVTRLQKSAKPLVFSAVQPAELVRSVMSSYESWIRSKGFELSCDIDPIEEQLWDREAVARALVNLIDNAIKYSSTSRRLHVALKDRQDAVELSVTDSGVGIRSQDIPRLFEPYYRGQFSDTQTSRGAGLGLTLVQQIVTSHHGSVEVDSTVGQGSTFRLLFPKIETSETEPASELLRTRELSRVRSGNST